MAVDILALRETVTDLELKKKQIEAQIAEAKAELFKAVDAEGGSFSAEDGYVTKVVRPVRKSYDWETIKKRIGVVNYKKIIKEVPDENLLFEAIANGTISMDKVAGCVTEKETTPYVRTYKIREFEE